MNQETPATTTPETEEAKPGAARPARRPSPQQVPASLVPESGWHFLHLFYHVDRNLMLDLDREDLRLGREAFVEILGTKPEGVAQLQTFAVPGHKADFGIMLAGPDLKAVHSVETALAASPLGPALTPSYSFYSITEVSEYVPDAEQYAAILRDREKLDPESPMFQAKVSSYAERLGPMNQHRLYPEFPDWPCFCFYPMSKMRQGDQNWYLLPFEERSELMAQHGRSGMAYAGKVSQVITASTGLDDWEWGVTLWARNPLFLKDIVYTMRFDVSSAKYALFGDFYFGYFLPPEELLATLRI
ncbi:hydrogen peroxide-dependent heme synthase [Planctomyces sp. SH-PL62]|uniref:hydrogen peroxide-dependent heme synthase n=1 Tax=Planctomyces sp. SH-PL62 TaxID=1636152 RepID=UPI00078C6288|nr:hydrogen peroxide-dependent heme synthase [Planctomyces sp. SH-PL62]AMV38963.1 putative heme peroxidase [Planctomyces sp. SH-PL62]